MIGTTLHHPSSGTTGKVDQIAGHPDGKCLVRINDHWLLKDECVKAGLMWPAVIVAALVLVGIALYGLSLVS